MKTRIFRIFYWSDGEEWRQDVGTAGFFTGDLRELEKHLLSRFGKGWELEIGWEEINTDYLNHEITKIEDEINTLTDLVEEAQFAKAKFEDD